MHLAESVCMGSMCGAPLLPFLLMLFSHACMKYTAQFGDACASRQARTHMSCTAMLHGITDMSLGQTTKTASAVCGNWLKRPAPRSIVQIEQCTCLNWIFAERVDLTSLLAVAAAARRDFPPPKNTMRVHSGRSHVSRLIINNSGVIKVPPMSTMTPAHAQRNREQRMMRLCGILGGCHPFNMRVLR